MHNSQTPLLKDILGEPASLVRTLEYQMGTGRLPLLAAARAIRTAGRVLLTGMGGSFTPCLQLSYQLGAAGFSSVAVEAGEFLHYLAPWGSRAVVVMVSRSGETVEIARLIPEMKARGATLVGVTNVLESVLAREADHVIFVDSLADGSVALQTYVSTVATLLLLGAAVRNEPLENWHRDLAKLANALDAALPGLIEVSDAWRDFLQPDSHEAIYLLGRGPSYGSAVEGGFMLNEMARVSAVGVSAGGFRHGSVEMVDSHFRGLVFASQQRTRDLDLTLAAELQAFGGRVRVIAGPGATGGKDLPPCWRIPDLPDVISPIAEIVPVQIAGFRLAEWRGLPLGQFRYVTEVTTDERSLVTRRQS